MSRNIEDITPNNTTINVNNFLGLSLVIILKKEFKKPELYATPTPISPTINVPNGANVVKLFNKLLIRYCIPVLLNKLFIVTICGSNSPVAVFTV